MPSIYQRLYLTVYNLVSFVGWSSILVRALHAVLIDQSPLSSLYALVGADLRRVQTLAVFEVLHAVLGVVKSPIMTTATQILSRLLIVWVNLYWITEVEVQQHWAFATLLVAWCTTECIRYSLYGLAQWDIKPWALTWLRYSSFLPLYPLGVFSECMIIYQSLPAAKAVSPALYYAFWVVILVVYPPGLFMLYTYMLRQRKKVLGGGGHASKAKKVKSN